MSPRMSINMKMKDAPSIMLRTLTIEIDVDKVDRDKVFEFEHVSTPVVTLDSVIL